MYSLHEQYNYMYNRMVPSTKYLSRYKLLTYDQGIIIQYPRSSDVYKRQIFEDAPRYHQNLKRARMIARLTKCNTVLGINRYIEQNGSLDLISLAEAHHNRQLNEICNIINKKRNKIRIICIAGPSSSGKTTFANRLRMELLSYGYDPIRISLDDYYHERCRERGIDVESVEAFDLDLFNQNMNDLLANKAVKLPKFNFTESKRYFTKPIKIKRNQTIIVEGIHALNELTSKSIDKEKVFKIYIAPNAQLNLDDHNPISLTDLRLLRRIVRDKQFRNTSLIETLEMWPNVRKGEFTWIYKTQENADYEYNSFLYYELPSLKKYAEPLLREINRDNMYFPIVERLLRMLKFFVGIDDKYVPFNSILREFIGGSCYQDV